MGFAGLIAGALGGAAKGYTEYAESELKKSQELDLRKQLMDAEEAKQLRIDEIRRGRDLEYKKREINEVAPLQAEADANRTRVVGAAETGVLADREGALREGKVETARQTGLAQGEVERTNAAAYATDPKARAGVRAKASDQESSATKVAAAAGNFELAQKKGLADLRTKLSQTTDPEQRTQLDQQIRDLSGGSTKSYADMVTAGDAFRKLAANLRQQLKDDPTLSDAEQADIRDRIRVYENQAASVLGATVDKRLGGGGGQPKPPAKPASGASAPRPALNSFYK